MRSEKQTGDQISGDDSNIHTKAEEGCTKTVQSYKTDHIGRTRVVADQKQRLAGKEAVDGLCPAATLAPRGYPERKPIKMDKYWFAGGALPDI